MKELATEILRFLNNLFTFVNKSGKVIKKISLMYDNLRNMMSNGNIESAIIFCAHNGGKRMRVYSPAYISCLHQDYLSPMESVKNGLQRVPLDRVGAEILSRLIDNKKVDIETDNLEQGSLFRSMFESEGIRRGQLFYLKETKSFFYFLCVTTSNDLASLKDAETDLRTRIAVSNIKELIA